MQWDLTLTRTSINKLNEETIRKKLRLIAEVASRNQSLGFTGKVGKLSEPVLTLDPISKQESYVYTVKLRLLKEIVRSPETVEERFQYVLKQVTRKANACGWDVSCGECQTSTPTTVSTVERKNFVLPPLTDEVLETYFTEIYERDEHIRQVYAAIQTTVETQGEELSHVLLYGLPGSCKSKLAKAFMEWFNAALEDTQPKHFMEVDGTTMSKAGLENWLLEMAGNDLLPTVLFIDELEKQNTENLFCLHNVMGSGVIAKCNARIGNRRESAKFTVIGTCNDEEKMKTRAEALWSRFNHQVYCPRPSKDLCRKILMDTLAKFPGGGKEEWVEAALKFGWDELHQRDIRTIKGHLDGRDRLLDGSWQEGQRRLIHAMKLEKEAVRREGGVTL